MPRSATSYGWRARALPRARSDLARVPVHEGGVHDRRLAPPASNVDLDLRTRLDDVAGPQIGKRDPFLESWRERAARDLADQLVADEHWIVRPWYVPPVLHEQATQPTRQPFRVLSH